MTDQHISVAHALLTLEGELRRLDLWEEETPSSEALASSQPFAVDTLSFPQWLQFMFIPRLYQLVKHRSNLPANSGVAPMAEEYFKTLNVNSAELIAQLETLDKLLSTP